MANDSDRDLEAVYEALADLCVNKSLSAVETVLTAVGVRYRKTRIDGRPTVVTRDYKRERFNLTVEAGIVREVTRG